MAYQRACTRMGVLAVRRRRLLSADTEHGFVEWVRGFRVLGPLLEPRELPVAGASEAPRVTTAAETPRDTTAASGMSCGTGTGYGTPARGQTDAGPYIASPIPRAGGASAVAVASAAARRPGSGPLLSAEAAFRGALLEVRSGTRAGLGSRTAGDLCRGEIRGELFRPCRVGVGDGWASARPKERGLGLGAATAAAAFLALHSAAGAAPGSWIHRLRRGETRAPSGSWGVSVLPRRREAEGRREGAGPLPPAAASRSGTGAAPVWGLGFGEGPLGGVAVGSTSEAVWSGGPLGSGPGRGPGSPGTASCPPAGG